MGVLRVLHTTLAGWFSLRFVFAKAERPKDEPVTSRLSDLADRLPDHHDVGFI